MDNSFRTFLQSTTKTDIPKSVVKQNITETVQSKETNRVVNLQEKVSLYCKKFGEFGMDSLDTFFKESVERMIGVQQVQVQESVRQVTPTPTKNLSVMEHAMALMEDVNPTPSTGNFSPSADKNDMMSKASMLMM